MSKSETIRNLTQTIEKGGDEKMVAQLKRRLTAVEKGIKINKR